MKFAAIAFIVGLCVVAVTANATGDFKIDSEDFELDSQELSDDVIEFESRSIFYFSLIKVLKTLKGLNCIIKEVRVILNAGSQLVDNINDCGGAVSQKVQNLINACNAVVETSKAILGINQSVCGNGDETDIQSRTWHVVSGAQNAHKCFVQIFKNVRKLNKQVKSVTKMIGQIKKAPGDTSQCVVNSIDLLATHFTDFPGNVKACSKLTSN